jgi:hypothetical protein
LIEGVVELFAVSDLGLRRARRRARAIAVVVRPTARVAV